MRGTIATLAIFFGGLGTIAGPAILIYVANFGKTEGDAMFAGAGIVFLFVAIPLLAIGLLMRPRPPGPTPPNDPAA